MLLAIIKKINLTILLLIACLVTGSAAYGRAVTDQVGRTVVVPDNPQRVIALAPSITEIIYELGEEKRLRGVTRYSDFPAQAKALPKVGSYIHLDLEKIVALKPDLCLSTKDGNPKHVIDKITRLGIPVYAINPRSLEQTMDTIARIGSLLNAEHAAAELVSDMQQRIKQVQLQIEQADHRPRVFFQIDAEPLVSAGNNTFIHEMIEMAGGINTAAGNDPYPRYSWEDILILQPDIVIISSMAGGLDSEGLLRTWKKWAQLKAVINEQVFVVDAGMFDRTTPRLIDGLEAIVEIIHPELFKQGQKMILKQTK